MTAANRSRMGTRNAAGLAAVALLVWGAVALWLDVVGHAPPLEGPFDAIVVTAGAPEIPEVLINQLAEGGRLVVPVGNQHTQELIKICRTKGKIQQTNLGGCRFVKLVGEHGWKEH